MPWTAHSAFLIRDHPSLAMAWDLTLETLTTRMLGNGTTPIGAHDGGSGLRLAQELLRHGVPVVVCTPGPGLAGRSFIGPLQAVAGLLDQVCQPIEQAPRQRQE